MAAALKVVIVGGGTAGWMCAAALSRLLDASRYNVCLIESDDIGTVGVGEATLPHLKVFNDTLGINEAAFMRATGATFKLGIEFAGWGRQSGPPGNPGYIHPFGTFGEPWGGIDFHQHWLRAKRAGYHVEQMQDYSFAIAACRGSRFEFPHGDPGSIGATYSYAYHLDAFLYARFLRQWATQRDVVRIEGEVVDVAQDAETGAITSLTLKSGNQIVGDLFVDASGFRSLLLGGGVGAPWEDWNAWLPCDRALAVPTRHEAAAGDDVSGLIPYTRATAQPGGWIWRIPLQHRVGNGYVYSSGFIRDGEAADTLRRSISGAAMSEPRLLRFSAGRRVGAWTKNCVGIGLASGFLEPLESTSIYLIQKAVLNLVDLIPANPGPVDQRLVAEYNRLIDIEYERIRDFLILHYYANGRQGEALWDYTRAMSIPDSLRQKIDLFEARGYVPDFKDGLFSKDSWLAVFLGQGVSPRASEPLTDAFNLQKLEAKLTELRARIAMQVMTMSTHRAFIARFCATSVAG